MSWGLRWPALAVPVVVAVLVFASPAHSPVAAANGCAGQRPGGATLALSIGGEPRSAWVHVPAAGASPRALPLVIALHGSGGDGRFMESYSGLSAMSDRG